MSMTEPMSWLQHTWRSQCIRSRWIFWKTAIKIDPVLETSRLSLQTVSTDLNGLKVSAPVGFVGRPLYNSSQFSKLQDWANKLFSIYLNGFKVFATVGLVGRPLYELSQFSKRQDWAYKLFSTYLNSLKVPALVRFVEKSRCWLSPEEPSTCNKSRCQLSPEEPSTRNKSRCWLSLKEPSTCNKSRWRPFSK